MRNSICQEPLGSKSVLTDWGYLSLRFPIPLFPENLCTDISKIVSSLYFSITFFCTHKYLSLTVYVVQCTDLFGLCESRAKANCSARNYLRPSRNPKKKCPKSGGASGLEKKKCKISLFSGNSSSSTADSNIIVLQEKKGQSCYPTCTGSSSFSVSSTDLQVRDESS